MRKTRIVGFEPKYLPDFISLNQEWIQKYFEIEPMDTAQLEGAGTHIIARGGEILFLLHEEETGSEKVVGTCALIPHGKGAIELAKMAIAPSTRGMGFGDELLLYAIGRARAMGALKLDLISNTILEAAIKLYEKHGFKTTRLGQHPEYKRGNIEMELDLRRQF